jgi:hypothetical protein
MEGNWFGNYSKRQDRAYDLDLIIDYAAEKGVYIMLCFNNHGAVSTYVNPEWRNNPYNIKNGGPCKNTEDFFTDTTAIKYYLRKLKYMNARWGYSPNIFSWEFFNEIEWTDFYQQNRDKVIEWQKLNAKFLKSIDVNNHLLSTSYAHSDYDSKMWEQPEIDFTQTHFYSNSSDIELIQVNAIRNYINNFNKPTLIGEFGLSDRRQSIVEMDPKGINFHNSLWTSAVAGAYGTSMLWWWDYYLHPLELYKYYKPLSEFIASIDYLKEDYRPYDNISFECNKNSDLIISPGFSLFEKSPSNYFFVDSLGIRPAASELGTNLFSDEFWNLGRNNPPSFEVNFDDSHDFTVFVGDTSFNSCINIKVDGVEKINQLAGRDSSYTVKIPPGKHIITIDNTGERWLRISRIEITNCTPSLRGFASIGKTGIIGWLHNKDYNWKYIKKNGFPPAISGKVKLQGLPHGVYRIEIIDCNTGKIREVIQQSINLNELIFDIKDLQWDCAFKLQRVDSKIKDQFIPDFEFQNYYPQVFNLQQKDLLLKANKSISIKASLENYLGQKMDFISSGLYSIGDHKIKWNSDNLAPGFYTIKLSTTDRTYIEKYFLLE